MGIRADEIDHTLENLLDYNGRIQVLECGWWIKFEFRRVEPSRGIPHGVRYSMTLHNQHGTRMVGFDNAHTLRLRRGAQTKWLQPWDHWHKSRGDKGRAYPYADGAKLIQDFFDAVEHTLKAHGLEYTVASEGEEEA